MEFLEDDQKERILMARRVQLLLKEIAEELTAGSNSYFSSRTDNSLLLGTLEKLSFLLGCELVEEAISLVETDRVYFLTDPISGRSLYEVLGTSTQTHYNCFADVNYCQCQGFQEKVIKEQSAFTCKHVMAVWLAKHTNKVKTRTVGQQTVSLAIKQLAQYAYEFY